MARPFDHIKPRLTRSGPDPARARAEVLLIHGAWAGAFCFADLAPAIAREGFGVNCLELPGHGEDRWDLPASTSLRDYADIARRAAAGLGRPVLVGHSMGGWLAQKVLEVVDLPAVFLAPAPGKGVGLSVSARLLARHLKPALRVFQGRQPRVQDLPLIRKIFFGEHSKMDLEELLPNMAPEPPLVVLELMLGLVRATPPKGKAPRLLVAGAKDPFLPLAGAQNLARNLGARLAVLPDYPHALFMEDDSGLVQRLLLEFLGNCP